jgi:hypothetical protein
MKKTPEEEPNLRKYLIAAVAAFTAFAVVSVATAQTPGATGTVELKPNKFTKKKKKRKSVTLTLDVQNADSTQTANRIQVSLAKQLAVSGKGLKTCKIDPIELDTSKCSKGSKLGSGNAQAIAGVNGTAPATITFDVTAYLLSKKKIGFLIAQRDGNINTLSVGTLKKGSGKYGTVLDIDIPKVAREFPNGSFNGLKSIHTTMGKKAGKNALFKLKGCPSSKKLPFRTVISFQNNPNPPKVASVTADSTATCTK